MSTAATTGLISIDLAELWRAHWLRAWGDIGRVHYMRETETHIDYHDRAPAWMGPCECFSCRVELAWALARGWKPAPRAR
jgi:hypothetical protein